MLEIETSIDRWQNSSFSATYKANGVSVSPLKLVFWAIAHLWTNPPGKLWQMCGAPVPAAVVPGPSALFSPEADGVTGGSAVSDRHFARKVGTLREWGLIKWPLARAYLNTGQSLFKNHFYKDKSGLGLSFGGVTFWGVIPFHFIPLHPHKWLLWYIVILK